LIAWRTTERAYGDQERAFNGRGASEHGGRWNSKNVRMVYAADSLALTMLEQLVHYDDIDFKQYVTFRIAIPDELIITLLLAKMPKGWQTKAGEIARRKLGDDWVREQHSAVLRLPNAHDPQEFTFLLNPLHPDFPKLQISPALPVILPQRIIQKLRKANRT
jgi:RES domain-containing protein